MKNPTLLKAIVLSSLAGSKYLTLVALLAAFSSLPFLYSANSQTRPRVTGQSTVEPDKNASAGVGAEVLKVDVDLVTIDALVLQKQTARVVGDLTKDDFVLAEDGVNQQITHFSQDSLPLSVLLLVDRGGCLDPFGSEVRKAALDAIDRLKPTDEIALMTYHTNVELLQEFTRNRDLIADALNHVPPHDEQGSHCLNKAFAAAAEHMQRAGNPIGRRVIIVITGVTRFFDCSNGPSHKAAAQAVYESGAVVSAILPKTGEQQMENGVMIWATRIGRLGGAPYMDIQTLANETGGEILQDKPENLNTTFNTLISHLRIRYNLAFVSTNKKRDGSTRKLKIEVAPTTQKNKGKLVVKARHSYVAPRK
jgi:VWFA-related protein